MFPTYNWQYYNNYYNNVWGDAIDISIDLKPVAHDNKTKWML